MRIAYGLAVSRKDNYFNKLKKLIASIYKLISHSTDSN